MKTTYFYMAICTLCMATQTVAAQKTERLKGAAGNDTIKNVILPQVEVINKIKEKRGVTFFNAKQIEVMKASTLGETLSKIPGIQSFSFGPNTGLPMIRSLSGSRVKVLQDGIGLNNMSGITPTVNIAIDQDKLRGLEVFKGSATVLYGGKAIGGAINLRNGLIPQRVQGKQVEATAIAELASNSGTRQSFSVTGNIGHHLAWHIGAMYHHNKEVRIPGNSKSAMAYDTAKIAFDPMLQAMAQVDVNSEHVRNNTLYPYRYDWTKEYMEKNELSENDRYTFNSHYYDSHFNKVPIPANPIYVPGQDKVKDLYKDVVRSITDWGATKKGKITNSHSKGNAVETGLSYTSQFLNIGAGYRHTYSDYGIPGYAMTDILTSSHTHSDGTVHTIKKIEYAPINMRSAAHLGKLQAEVVNCVPLFPYIKIQGLLQHSQDDELLGSILANRLDASRHSMRIELNQSNLGYLNGVTGVDYDHRRVKSSGNLRYMPNNHSTEWGFFTSQHADYKFMHADIGYRHDQVWRQAMADTAYKAGRGVGNRKQADRHYALHQFNAHLRADLWNTGYLTASYSHSERSPEVNELYMSNVHFAIVTEEYGDDNLDKETANTIELGGGVNWKGLQLSVNYYNSYFNNYIYLRNTGFTRGGVIVREWHQGATQIYGVETQASYRLNLNHLGCWELSGYYDLVKNKNVSDDEHRRHQEGDYMPNMPTSRMGFALSGMLKNIAVNVDFDRYLKQKYLGKNLNPQVAFPSYNLLGARISYTMKFKHAGMELYLYGKNLLNEECRPQNSLLRYLAPLPGINIGGGIKVTI
ncbi:MAG TPA: TonB-dependent receptor [Prevotella sp.]